MIFQAALEKRTKAARFGKDAVAVQGEVTLAKKVSEASVSASYDN